MSEPAPPGDKPGDKPEEKFVPPTTLAVTLTLIGIIAGVCLLCTGATVGYGLFLDWKSAHTLREIPAISSSAARAAC